MDLLCATVEIIASFIECLLIPGVIVAACGTRYGKRKTLCLLLLVACAYTLYVALMNSWKPFSFITPIGGMLISIFAGKFLSNGNVMMRSLSCVLAMFVIQSVDYIMFIGMGLLQGNPRELFYVSMLPGAARISYLAINKGCDLILFCLFHRHLKSLSKPRRGVSAGLLACALLSYGTMQYLFATVLGGDYVQLQGAMMISLFVLLCFVLILVFSMIAVTASEKEKVTNQMLTSMNHLMETNYYILNESITKSAKTMHDFHHHLVVIDSLAQHEKPTQICEYVHSVMDTSSLPIQLCRCGNHIVDAVINSKMSEARHKGIPVEYRIIINDLSAFEQADICAILSNQIENALEACEKITQEKKLKSISASGKVLYCSRLQILPHRIHSLIIRVSLQPKRTTGRHMGLG